MGWDISEERLIGVTQHAACSIIDHALIGTGQSHWLPILMPQAGSPVWSQDVFPDLPPAPPGRAKLYSAHCVPFPRGDGEKKYSALLGFRFQERGPMDGGNP